jgi:hypothetical protein
MLSQKTDSTNGQVSDREQAPVIRRGRIRIGLFITLFGFLVFLLGASPATLGVDRSSVFGFVQIATLLVGLAIICIGGYISLTACWNGRPLSIVADIGFRLVSTGYVIAVFTGMADTFGLGSNLFPDIPCFGPWQALGVQIGEGIIAIGFILLIPFGHKR